MRVCLVILCAVIPSTLVAQYSDQRTAVLAVVDSVFQSMVRKDTALLTRQFDRGARLVGLRSRDTTEVLQALTVEQFARFLANDQRGQWVERIHDPEVRIEGTLATVWARYEFSMSGQFSHCGVDAIQLLRTGGRWRIVTLADTFQRTGCPGH